MIIFFVLVNQLVLPFGSKWLELGSANDTDWHKQNKKHCQQIEKIFLIDWTFIISQNASCAQMTMTRKMCLVRHFPISLSPPPTHTLTMDPLAWRWLCSSWGYPLGESPVTLKLWSLWTPAGRRAEGASSTPPLLYIARERPGKQ